MLAHGTCTAQGDAIIHRLKALDNIQHMATCSCCAGFRKVSPDDEEFFHLHDKVKGFEDGKRECR